MKSTIEMETPFLFIGDVSIGLGEYIYEEAIESARGAILKHKGEPCGIRALSYLETVSGDKLYYLDCGIFGVVDLSLNKELSSSRVEELKEEGTIIRIPSKRCEVTLEERDSSIYISIKDLDTMDILYAYTFIDVYADSVDEYADNTMYDVIPPKSKYTPYEDDEEDHEEYYNYYAGYDLMRYDDVNYI